VKLSQHHPHTAQQHICEVLISVLMVSSQHWTYTQYYGWQTTALP